MPASLLAAARLLSRSGRKPDPDVSPEALR